MLKLAGGLSGAIALLHVAVILAGAPAYRYFGAGEEMATLAERGSLVPALITLLVTLVFSLFALYAFSGAGLVRRLPLLRLGLCAIAGIYVLRGVLVIPQAVAVGAGAANAPPARDLVFSGVSLLIGLAYLAGVIGAWRGLGKAEA